MGGKNSMRQISKDAWAVPISDRSFGLIIHKENMLRKKTLDTNSKNQSETYQKEKKDFTLFFLWT
jgi:hypothetical protein